MPTRILLRLLLLAGLAAPLCALALGVGPLEVRSALNQNLDAEIPLIVNNPAELVGLTVRIPRQQEFDQVGIERLEFLSKLRFAVQTTPGGPSLIKITSIQPIREPSFDLLMEVVWPRGRLLRTFPIHLDPELYADRRQPPPLEAPPVQAPLIAAPSMAAAPATPGLPPAPPVSFDGASFYGPVKRGENLTRIANQVRPSTAISVPEMMAILVAGNPEAFANGNPNTLRAGAVLRVPSPQALGMSGAPSPAPVPDVAAVTPVEPEVSPPTLPVSPPEAAVSPAPVEAPLVPVAPPPAEISPTVAESAPPPMPIAPPQEIVPQATIPQVEPQPAPAEAASPPSAATEAPPPPIAETQPPPAPPSPVAKPPAPPQETGMDWLSNPVVWIAIALIVLAVGAVLLLPLLRRPVRPKTTAAREPSAPSADIGETREVAISSETRPSFGKSEARSKRPIPAAIEAAAARPSPVVAEPVVKPVPKAAATPPPKPIDELLKDIDFNLGDERSRMVPEGKGASPARGGEAQRMPDAEPPTASVTRTPSPFAPESPVKLAKPAPTPAPSLPQPLLEPLSELPSELQLDKLDFDLGDLGLDSTRKPAELPPLELKPAAPSKSADLADLDFNFPIEPPTQSDLSAESPKPKATDLKFEFTDVNQEQVRTREDMARLDEELQSFGDSGLDLGKMALSSPPGGVDAGADYVETKLDLAAAYLDMGDQVGAKGLLDDVLQEGDAAQKKRAEDMLKKLG
jgi:pilus assembly protein FimV